MLSILVSKARYWLNSPPSFSGKHVQSGVPDGTRAFQTWFYAICPTHTSFLPSIFHLHLRIPRFAPCCAGYWIACYLPGWTVIIASSVRIAQFISATLSHRLWAIWIMVMAKVMTKVINNQNQLWRGRMMMMLLLWKLGLNVSAGRYSFSVKGHPVRWKDVSLSSWETWHSDILFSPYSDINAIL